MDNQVWYVDPDDLVLTVERVEAPTEDEAYKQYRESHLAQEVEMLRVYTADAWENGGVGKVFLVAVETQEQLEARVARLALALRCSHYNAAYVARGGGDTEGFETETARLRPLLRQAERAAGVTAEVLYERESRVRRWG